MLYILLFSFVVSIVNILISLYLSNQNLCIFNQGVAFGMGVENIFVISMLLIFSLIVLGIVSRGYLRYFFFSISFLGLSNFIVRVIFDGICDYINMFGISFNLSDFFIVVISFYLSIQIISSSNIKEENS